MTVHHFTAVYTIYDLDDFKANEWPSLQGKIGTSLNMDGTYNGCPWKITSTSLDSETDRTAAVWAVLDRGYSDDETVQIIRDLMEAGDLDKTIADLKLFDR